MAKYESLDSITGVEEGKIVEMTEEELNKKPRNSYFKLVEPVDEKTKIVESEKNMLKVQLAKKLMGEGLSKKRTDTVVEQYDSIDELTKNLSGLEFDKLTNDFLKDLFGKKPEKSKKGDK